MQRIDDPSNVPTLPAPLSTVSPGYFRRPSVLAGDQGTIVTADFLNDVQENIVQAILGAGLTLAKGTGTKLRDAIDAKIATHLAVAASESVSAHARFATAAEVLAQTLATASISPLRLKQAFPASFGNPGYFQIPTLAGNLKVNFGNVDLNNAVSSIALASAYSTDHLWAGASPDIWSAPSHTGTAASARPHNSTPLTHVQVRNEVSSTFTIYWWSFGI